LFVGTVESLARAIRLDREELGEAATLASAIKCVA
jgi:hypothetical protein